MKTLKTPTERRIEWTVSEEENEGLLQLGRIENRDSVSKNVDRKGPVLSNQQEEIFSGMFDEP